MKNLLTNFELDREYDTYVTGAGIKTQRVKAVKVRLAVEVQFEPGDMPEIIELMLFNQAHGFGKV